MLCSVILILSIVCFVTQHTNRRMVLTQFDFAFAKLFAVLVLLGLTACSNFDDVGDVSYIPPDTSTSNGTTATSNSTTGTSNGTTATSNGTTATSNGTTATSNGTTMTSNGTRCVPGPELCDGEDNDCDDLIDEANPELLSACTPVERAVPSVCDLGQCGYRCDPGSFDANNLRSDGCECELTAGGKDICDGVDNNCNGQTDEANLNADLFTACTLPNTVGASCSEGQCELACSEGFRDVNNDLNQEDSNGCECQITNGGVEICDGEDNNCDGNFDEGCACEDDDIVPCGEDLGTCEAGTLRCEDGMFGQCVGSVGPANEVCDGEDNDCDGTADQENPALLSNCPALEGAQPTRCGEDAPWCLYTCQNNFWDLDDDLNKDDDSNGCEYACERTNNGVEICDGLDNDCNGQIDEENSALLELCAAPPGSAASCAEGACTYSCEGGFIDVNGDLSGDGSDGCECLPSPDPTELCDGQDNNCDGQTDEGCSCASGDQQSCGPGNGACRQGEQICVDGMWGTCVGGVGPSAELCDNIDNDCDSNVDEANSGQIPSGCDPLDGAQVAACTSGNCTYACRDSYVDVNDDLDTNNSNGCECQIFGSGTEVCDGIDNNCDGAVDENNQALLSECRVRTGAVPGTCSSGACNYRCRDGFIDLNGDLNNVDGSNGCEYACTRTNDSIEICDGLDNDCNGQTDEDGIDLLAACPERYHASPTQCQGGACWYACENDWVDLDGKLNSQNSDPDLENNGCEYHCTTPDSQQGVEVCDNFDNNCDGETNEPADTLLSNCEAISGASPASCEDNTCVYMCDDGRFDINGDLRLPNTDGCEYLCQISNGGVEICDGLDNDCNGEIDEGRPIDLCPFRNNTLALCQDMMCLYSCKTNFWDINGDLNNPEDDGSNGCEYACERTNDGLEICDGEDNNCNNVLDQLDTDYVETLCAQQDGVCSGSVAVCDDGELLECGEMEYRNHANALGLSYQPDDETSCDGTDNDCDDEVDEGCCGLDDAWIILDAENDVDQRNWGQPHLLSSDPSGRGFLAIWNEAERPDYTNILRYSVWNIDWGVDGAVNDFLTLEGYEPDAAPNGEGWSAIWKEYDDLFEPILIQVDIDAGGSLSPAFDWSSDGFDVYDPTIDVRISANEKVVAWHQEEIDHTIKVAYYSVSSGNSFSPTTFYTFSGLLGELAYPDIAFGVGTGDIANDWNGVVVWFERMNLLPDSVYRVAWKHSAETGTITGSSLIDSGEFVIPTIASFTDGYFITYPDLDANAEEHIRLIELDNAGQFVSNTWASVGINGFSAHHDPVVVKHSDGTLLAWKAHNSTNGLFLIMQRYDEAGLLSSQSTFRLGNQNSTPNIDVTATPTSNWMTRIFQGGTNHEIRLLNLDLEGNPVCYGD